MPVCRRLPSCALVLAIVLTGMGGRPGFAADDPDEEVARRHLERGRALAGQGRCDLAVEELERGRVIKPLPEFSIALGRCYDALGDRPRAASWYRNYVQLAPAGNAAERDEASHRLDA